MNKIYLALILGILFILSMMFVSAAVTTTLNYPSNNTILYNQSINCSASTTVGGIVNITLWHNGSGSFIANETIQTSVLSQSPHGASLFPAADETQNAKSGVRFKPTVNVNRIDAKIYGSGTKATKGYLWNSSKGLLETVNIVNDWANFTTPLTAGNTYFVVVDKDGSPYLSEGTADITSITVNNINFTSGLRGSDQANTTRLFAIQQINTHTSSTSASELFSKTFTAGQNINWNCVACASDGTCTPAPQNFTFSMDSTDPVLYVPQPASLVNYGKLGGNLTLQFRATDTNLASCWFSYDTTNYTVPCTTGVFSYYNFTLSNTKSLRLWANDTVGNLGSALISWNYSVFENSRTFNSTAYETGYESYKINVTSNTSLTGINLLFNGTSLAMTSLGSGIWSYARDLPTSSVGNNSIQFNFTFSGSSIYSDNSSQYVNPIYLALCNSTLNIKYINYTSKDQSLLSDVNFTINYNVNYYLGLGSVNKTLSYQNVANNNNYSFCFNAGDRTLNVLGNVQFASTGYPTRALSVSEVLTNSTTSRVLYLLSSSLGIFTSFNVVSGVGNNLAGALVTATININGIPTNVVSGVTDSSGLVSFFLDPTLSHLITSSYSGLPTFTTMITPTQPLYTINMGGGNNNLPPANGTTVGYNLTYIITPSNSSLLNNTSYDFGFNVNGLDIIYISETISNSSGYELGSVNGTNGLITTNINTGNETYLIGTYIIRTSTENLTFTKTWKVSNFYEGDYSLFYLMKSWDVYDFTYDYYKIIIMLLILVGAIGGLSKIEVTDTAESKIGLGLMIIWIFSYVGWLTINVSVASPANPLYNLNQWANQYGIAILATIAGIYSIKEWIN